MSNSSRKRFGAIAFMLLSLILATVFAQEAGVTVEKHCDEKRRGPVTKRAIVRSCSG